MTEVLILPFVREKVTCFTSPDRLLIFGVVSGSVNAGGTTPSLFLSWCLRPRPNVGVVFSPDCAGTLAFKHGRRGRLNASGNELDPAFLPGFTWVFCLGGLSPELPCTITVF